MTRAGVAAGGGRGRSGRFTQRLLCCLLMMCHMANAKAETKPFKGQGDILPAPSKRSSVGEGSFCQKFKGKLQRASKGLMKGPSEVGHLAPQGVLKGERVDSAPDSPEATPGGPSGIPRRPWMEPPTGVHRLRHPGPQSGGGQPSHGTLNLRPSYCSRGRLAGWGLQSRSPDHACCPQLSASCTDGPVESKNEADFPA